MAVRAVAAHSQRVSGTSVQIAQLPDYLHSLEAEDFAFFSCGMGTAHGLSEHWVDKPIKPQMGSQNHVHFTTCISSLFIPLRP
jgi:hypothetical protein